MGNLKWRYVKDEKDIEGLRLFESENKIKIPKTLFECITQNNGGRPTPNLFDTRESKSKIFDTLLSINKTDKENLYIAFNVLSENEFDNLLPFASDPFGNYIALDIKNKYSVVFWDHELNRTEYITGTLDEFLKSLY